MTATGSAEMLMANLSICPFCNKEFPSYEKRRDHQDACFKKQERKMEKRNLEKQALAGAKAMFKIQNQGERWNDFEEKTKQEYILMAKACIRAAGKTLIEV